MTPRKVVRRLVELGPLAISPRMSTPSHCVAATRIGIDALAVYGIGAMPLSVRVRLANAAWLAAADAAPEGGGDLAYWKAATAAGAHLIDTGGPRDGAGSVEGTSWLGHVVIWLPDMDGGTIVDLTMGQMNRPAKQIELPAAAVFPFKPLTSSYELPGGCQLAYTAKFEDKTYRAARDFDTARVADVTLDVVHAIRKGRVR